jgi:hypothetical protein
VVKVGHFLAALLGSGREVKLATQLSWVAVVGCFLACGNTTSGQASASGGMADASGGSTAGYAGRGSGGSAPSSGGAASGANSNSAGDGGASERAGASNTAGSTGSMARGGSGEPPGEGGSIGVSGGASAGGKLATTGGIGVGGVGGGAAAGVGGESAAGAPSCAELNMERQTWLQAAVVCSAELDGQCAGAKTVPNQCGCPTLVNSALDYQVKQAQAAYDAWVAAGCGPFACGAACFLGTMAICDPSRIGSSSCIWQ